MNREEEKWSSIGWKSRVFGIRNECLEKMKERCMAKQGKTKTQRKNEGECKGNEDEAQDTGKILVNYEIRMGKIINIPHSTKNIKKYI